nr:MAG TPA: hypothetical protein [Caudoviricetes sp.]DAR50814.1 MAG TPA: hypothetical protein [Caudoviricetes sp.]
MALYDVLAIWVFLRFLRRITHWISEMSSEMKRKS